MAFSAPFSKKLVNTQQHYMEISILNFIQQGEERWKVQVNIHSYT
jgi:hypothetical protein